MKDYKINEYTSFTTSGSFPPEKKDTRTRWEKNKDIVKAFIVCFIALGIFAIVIRLIARIIYIFICFIQYLWKNY